MTTNLLRNHEIEKIYMEQLRNAETSVYILSNKWNKVDKRIKFLKTPIAKEGDPAKPHLKKHFDYNSDMHKCWIALFVTFIICGFSFAVIADALGLNGAGHFLQRICFIISAIPGIGELILLFNTFRDYKKEQQNYLLSVEKNKATNKKNVKIMHNNIMQAKSLEATKSKIYNEYSQALKLRDSIYSINWIPSQYRNIQVVYYICDMVTSSNISIEEALKYYLLQEANNKLDEVLRKMDTIIENQNEIIMNQAIMKAQNQKLIQQNNNIIKQAATIEENTRLSAEYSQVGARYAEANAYFSLATYLKN